VVGYPGTFIDTGTPGDYLRANLHAAGGSNLIDPTAEVSGAASRSVIGAGAVVRGDLSDCVVWPGGVVAGAERLRRAIRAGADLTVHAG
jgi:N-acetyl-alpha-D-muramate 1-phosphate uridylyltransferase